MDSLIRDKLAVPAKSGTQIMRGGLAAGSLYFITDLLSENCRLSVSQKSVVLPVELQVPQENTHRDYRDR